MLSSIRVKLSPKKQSIWTFLLHLWARLQVWRKILKGVKRKAIWLYFPLILPYLSSIWLHWSQLWTYLSPIWPPLCPSLVVQNTSRLSYMGQEGQTTKKSYILATLSPLVYVWFRSTKSIPRVKGNAMGVVSTISPSLYLSLTMTIFTFLLIKGIGFRGPCF